MGVYRMKGRRIWMLKYYQDGAPVYESSGTSVHAEATAMLRKREGTIADGKHVSTRTGKLRWDAAAADVENDYKTNGKKSLDAAKRRIALHLTPFFGGRRMVAITTPLVREYIAQRQAPVPQPDGTELPGASNATINRELAVLKRAFSLAIKSAVLTAKPYIPMLAEQNVRTGFFEREQHDAIKRQLPAEWQPVMDFAYFTGWRVRSEVLPITWPQVDEHLSIVRLDVGTTKNAEGRTFPYDVLPELAAVLKAQARVRQALRAKGILSPYVFPDAAGGRLPAFYSDIWRGAAQRAGQPGKIPHDYRRTAVRNLVRAGVPEKTAMQLTGHKTRSVFDRYDIVNEDDLRAAVARLAGMPKAPRRGRK
jgi:site-specific recombinase XerD